VRSVNNFDIFRFKLPKIDLEHLTHQDNAIYAACMMTRKTFFLSLLFAYTVQSLCALSICEQFKKAGYVEIGDTHHGAATFDSLYVSFDAFIAFLQTNPVWSKKLCKAKERFIRSTDRPYYSTDFFGFYDESQKGSRGQISFYL